MRASGRTIPSRVLRGLAGLMVILTLLVVPETSSAAPGSPYNMVYFNVNASNPVASQAVFYIGGAAVGTYTAGSGTSTDPSDNNPCNKNYTTDSGGFLPGMNSAGGLVYFNSVTPYGMTHAYAPYGVGLQVNDKSAFGFVYGYVHDCQNYPYSIVRTALFMHRTASSGSSNYATYGCIKINWTPMDSFHNIFHNQWGGADNTYYSGVIRVNR